MPSQAPQGEGVETRRRPPVRSNAHGEGIVQGGRKRPQTRIRRRKSIVGSNPTRPTIHSARPGLLIPGWVAAPLRPRSTPAFISGRKALLKPGPHLSENSSDGLSCSS